MHNPFSELYAALVNAKRNGIERAISIVQTNIRAANQVLSHPAVVWVVENLLSDEDREMIVSQAKAKTLPLDIASDLDQVFSNPLTDAIAEIIREKQAQLQADESGYTDPHYINLDRFNTKTYINMPDPETGITPLHMCLMGRVMNVLGDRLAIHLIDNGADIRYKNPITGETILHLATMPALVRMAYDAGVNPSNDAYGNTPQMRFADEFLGSDMEDSFKDEGFDGPSLSMFGPVNKWVAENDNGMSLLSIIAQNNPELLVKYSLSIVGKQISSISEIDQGEGSLIRKSASLVEFIANNPVSSMTPMSDGDPSQPSRYGGRYGIYVPWDYIGLE